MDERNRRNGQFSDRTYGEPLVPGDKDGGTAEDLDALFRTRQMSAADAEALRRGEEASGDWTQRIPDTDRSIRVTVYGEEKPPEPEEPAAEPEDAPYAPYEESLYEDFPNEEADSGAYGAAAEDPEPTEKRDTSKYHEVSRKRKKHRRKHYLLRLLIVAAAVVLLCLFLSSDMFDIRKIDVRGNHYYSDEEIINMAQAKTGGNIFTNANKSEILDRLGQNPYFASVKVHRKLPDTLVIRVDERVQVAAAVYGDQYIVIDADGRVLRVTDVKPELTIIRGLTISRMEPGYKLKAEEAGTLKSMLSMLETMKDGDLYFTEIEISGENVTAHVTDQLVVKGTYSRLKKAVDSGSLAKVINRLFTEGTKAGTITVNDTDSLSFSPQV